MSNRSSRMALYIVSESGCPEHRLGPVAREEVEAKVVAVVYALPFIGTRADVVNSEEKIGQIPGPLIRILRIRYLPASDELRDDPRRSEHFACGVEEDGFRGRDTVLPRDLQSVIICGCTFGIGFVGHTLDDEAASLASGRNRVEHVDGVRKRSRGRSDGNQPVSRGRRYPRRVVHGICRIPCRKYRVQTSDSHYGCGETCKWG